MTDTNNGVDSTTKKQISLSMRFYRSADGGNGLQQIKPFVSAAIIDTSNTELMLSQHNYKRTGKLVEKAMRIQKHDSLHELRRDAINDPSAAVMRKAKGIGTTSIVAVTHANRIKEVLEGKLGEQLSEDSLLQAIGYGSYVDFEITMPADLQIDTDVECVIQRDIEQAEAREKIEKSARVMWKGLSKKRRESLSSSETKVDYYVAKQKGLKSKGLGYDEAAEPLFNGRSTNSVSGYFDKLANALENNEPLAEQGIEVKARIVNTFKTIEL